LERLGKEERILKEISKLRKVFKTIPKSTVNVVLALVENAAFMIITLEDLQETINSKGVVSGREINGSRFGTKKSPEIEVYNTMVKNLSSVIKQLTELVPPGHGSPSLIKVPDAFKKIQQRYDKIDKS